MDSIFNRKCLEVLHANSVKDFTRRIVNFAQDLGFNTVGALVITDHSPTLREIQGVANTPDAYREQFEDPALSRSDPVNQHCKQSSVPIIWNRQTYGTPAQRELWERQAHFGYRSGFAFAMHLGRGRHYMFGADWNHDRCEAVPHYRAILQDLVTFGAHSQAAAFELSTPTRPDPGNSWFLTKSELEALRWTMDGMNDWEIGQKMALSDWDVQLRLQRAMQKLDCGSKYEAVLKGIKLGLIEAI